MIPVKAAQIIVLLFCIIPTSREAKEIMTHLMRMGIVQKGLIAPATTFIREGGRIVTGKEVIFFTMINEKMVQGVMTEIKKIHSETDPCMLAIPVITDFDYAAGYIPTQMSDSLLDLVED